MYNILKKKKFHMLPKLFLNIIFSTWTFMSHYIFYESLGIISFFMKIQILKIIFDDSLDNI